MRPRSAHPTQRPFTCSVSSCYSSRPHLADSSSAAACAAGCLIRCSLLTGCSLRQKPPSHLYMRCKAAFAPCYRRSNGSPPMALLAPGGAPRRTPWCGGRGEARTTPGTLLLPAKNGGRLAQGPLPPRRWSNGRWRSSSRRSARRVQMRLRGSHGSMAAWREQTPVSACA